ncbi:unnamed protein product, partial [Ectocarpus sp. 4 AP-2014]
MAETRVGGMAVVVVVVVAAAVVAEAVPPPNMNRAPGWLPARISDVEGGCGAAGVGLSTTIGVGAVEVVATPVPTVDMPPKMNPVAWAGVAAGAGSSTSIG